MSTYQLTSVRLPKPILDAIETQLKAVEMWHAAKKNLSHHTAQFNEDMQRAIDANDHEFAPLIRHEQIGQELVDEVERQKIAVIIAAEHLTIAWVIAFGATISPVSDNI